MGELLVLRRPVSLERVEIHPVKTDLTDEATVAEIDELWQQALARARQHHTILFDSKVWSLDSVTVDEASVVLQVGVVLYRVRMIAKRHPHIMAKLGPQKALFTHIFLQSNDDRYVFLRRSKHYESDGNVAFIGGSFTAGQGVVEHIAEEVSEEIGICYEQLASPSLLGIYENEFGNCGVVVYARLNMASQELHDYFETWVQTIDRPEAKAITCVASAELEIFFDQHMQRYRSALNLLKHV